MRTTPMARLPATLTMTERRVLQLLATGWSNADIAADLYVSVATVRKHLENAYRKLGVTQPDGGRLAIGEGPHASDAPARRREIRLTANTARPWTGASLGGPPLRRQAPHDLSPSHPRELSASTLLVASLLAVDQGTSSPATTVASRAPDAHDQGPRGRHRVAAGRQPDHLQRGRAGSTGRQRSTSPSRRCAVYDAALEGHEARAGRGDRSGRQGRPRRPLRVLPRVAASARCRPRARPCPRSPREARPPSGRTSGPLPPGR